MGARACTFLKKQIAGNNPHWSLPYASMMGFHIRRGDMATIRGTHYANDPLNFAQEVENCIKLFDQPLLQGWPIFIATDDYRVWEDIRAANLPPHTQTRIFFNGLGRELRESSMSSNMARFVEEKKQNLRQTSLSEFMM
jgi:hypothetical protein